MGISVVHALPGNASTAALAGKSGIASSEDIATDFANLLTAQLPLSRELQAEPRLIEKDLALSVEAQAEPLTAEDAAALSAGALQAPTDPTRIIIDPALQAAIQQRFTQRTDATASRPASDGTDTLSLAPALNRPEPAPIRKPSNERIAPTGDGQRITTPVNGETETVASRPSPFAASDAQNAGVSAGNKSLISASEATPAAKLAVDGSPSGGNFAQSLLAAENRQTTKPVESAPPPLAVPIKDAAWGNQLGDRVVWMARQDIQSAQIQITPAQMGPIQITLDLKGDQLSATFSSVQPEVRQAIEDALPRLKEMLASSGINLGQANVGAQTPQQQQDQAARNAETPRWRGEAAILPPDNPSQTAAQGVIPLNRGRGLVDLFA